MRKLKYFLFAIIILMTTCNQDPVFYAIYQEVEIREARIKGTPTNMVVFERNGNKAVYVASGKIHWYAKNNNTEDRSKWWDRNNGKVPQPIKQSEREQGGKVVGLAATSTHLYALCLNASTTTTKLRRIGNNDNEWTTIKNSDSKHRLQSVFASGDKVFVGAMLKETKDKSIPCAIFYFNETENDLVPLKSGSGIFLLNGVAWDGTGHYLSTKDQYNKSTGKLYYLPDSAFSTPSPENELKDLVALASDGDEKENPSHPGFMNIISLENGSTPEIVAIARNGWLYRVNTSGFTALKQTKNTTSGALALYRDRKSTEWNDWKDDDTRPLPELLLVSIQGANSSASSSSRTNGYREAELQWNTADKSLDTVRFHEPGKNTPSTLTNNERYLSTIGIFPVYHIFQTPREIDEQMTLFASTSTAGLWSYRQRESGTDKKKSWQWNAEEE